MTIQDLSTSRGTRSRRFLQAIPSSHFWVEVATLGGGQFATVVGAIVATRFLTRLLTPAAYGDLALALTIAALLSLVGSGPVGNAVGRFFAVAQEKGTLRGYFWATAMLYSQYHVVVCCLAFSVLLIIRCLTAPPAWTSMAAAATALSLVNGAGVLLDAMQNAARQRLVVAWHQAAGQWLRLVGAIICIRWTGATAASALSGYAAASVIILVSQLVFFKCGLGSLAAVEPVAPKAMVGAISRAMRSYANPFLVFGAIAWLQQSSDRWMLALFGTRTDLGLYQVLNQVGYSPLIQLSSLITLVVAPIFFSQAGDGNDLGRVTRARDRIRRLSWLLFAATLLSTGLLWRFGNPLFTLVVAPEYRSASPYLPLAALAGGLFATGQMLATDAMVQLKTKTLVVPKLGSALLAIGLNYAGVRTFGLTGVVWAGVLTSGAYALWMAVLTRRGTPFTSKDRLLDNLAKVA